MRANGKMERGEEREREREGVLLFLCLSTKGFASCVRVLGKVKLFNTSVTHQGTALRQWDEGRKVGNGQQNL